MRHTVRISLHYATFGIVVADDVVVDAPPIARWMRGRSAHMVGEWVHRKGGTAMALPGEQCPASGLTNRECLPSICDCFPDEVARFGLHPERFIVRSTEETTREERQ